MTTSPQGELVVKEVLFQLDQMLIDWLGLVKHEGL